MIKAHHTTLGQWFWAQFSKWSIKLRFHTFRIEKTVKADPQRPMLLIGNHISWWDGFWPLWLNRKYFRKRFHVMMLEEELKKRRFMRQGGAFSIHPNKRSMLESLDYVNELLKDADNLVVIYPQGKIHSMSDHRIRFEKGLERILTVCGEETQVVFSVVLVDYFARARPTVFYYLGEWEGISNKEQGFLIEEVEEAYNRFYRLCLAEHRRRKV